MRNMPLDIYEEMPDDMKRYIKNYGWHFNRKAYDFATKQMSRRNPKTNKEERIVPYTKAEIDELLDKHGIELKNKVMYDYVFAGSMCKADYLGGSVPDEEHLAMYIKETVDDVDASSETTFRRWVSTMVGNGVPIDWYEIC